MEAKITAEELTVLAWFHENAVGYGPKFAEFHETLESGTDIKHPALMRAVTYLDGWGLVGCVVADRGYSGERPECMLTSVWFTSAGENYMRILDAQPGIAKRVTVAVLRSAGDAILKVAGIALAEVIKAQMNSTFTSQSAPRQL